MHPERCPEDRYHRNKRRAGNRLRYLLQAISKYPEISDAETITLRGTPPLGVCTICIGKKDIGWQHHFGVIRPLEEADNLYRGD